MNPKKQIHIYLFCHRSIRSQKNPEVIAACTCMYALLKTREMTLSNHHLASSDSLHENYVVALVDSENSNRDNTASRHALTMPVLRANAISSPTMPRRNASTHTTKIKPMITCTHE